MLFIIAFAALVVAWGVRHGSRVWQPWAVQTDVAVVPPTVLQKRVSLDVVDKPLREVIDKLATEHGLPLEIRDGGLLDDHALRRHRTVTATLHDVRLQALLDTMLQAYAPSRRLTFSGGHAAVVAERDLPLVSRVHPLADLLGISGESDASLEEVIQQVIAPSTWSDSGVGSGEIDAVPGALLVMNYAWVQEDISRLLQLLSQPQDRPFPAPALEEGDAGIAEENAALERQLAQRVDLNLLQESLDEALRRLTDEYGVSFLLDQSAVDVTRGRKDARASLHVRDMPLKSALRLLLGDFGLQYHARNGIIWIEERWGDATTTRVYPIHDLRKWLGKDLEELTGKIEWLIGSWGEGHTIGLSCGCLVVTQTDDVHQDLGRMLSQLRAVASSGVGPRPPTYASSPMIEALERPIALASGKQTPRNFARWLADEFNINVDACQYDLEETPNSVSLPPFAVPEQPLIDALRSALDIGVVIEHDALVLASPGEEDAIVHAECYRPTDFGYLPSIVSPEELRRALTDLLDPDEWGDTGNWTEGNGGTIFHKVIGDVVVVSANQGTHRRIRELAAAIRERRLPGSASESEHKPFGYTLYDVGEVVREFREEPLLGVARQAWYRRATVYSHTAAKGDRNALSQLIQWCDSTPDGRYAVIGDTLIAACDPAYVANVSAILAALSDRGVARNAPAAVKLVHLPKDGMRTSAQGPHLGLYNLRSVRDAYAELRSDDIASLVERLLGVHRLEVARLAAFGDVMAVYATEPGHAACLQLLSFLAFEFEHPDLLIHRFDYDIRGVTLWRKRRESVDEVDDLIAQLASDEPCRRATAALALSLIPDPSPQVIEVMASHVGRADRSAIQPVALEALHHYGVTSVDLLPALQAVFDQRHPIHDQELAVRVMLNLGDQAVPVLGRLIGAGRLSAKDVGHCLESLGKDAQPLLPVILEWADEQQRLTAVVESFGTVDPGHKYCLSILAGWWESGDPRRRERVRRFVSDMDALPHDDPFGGPGDPFGTLGIREFTSALKDLMVQAEVQP